MIGASISICSYSICEMLFITLERYPTPVGSTMRYSGAIEFAIVSMFKAKSVFPVQHMHFSVSSHTLSSDSSFRISSSTLRDAYSFSSITKSRFNIFDIALINVVFPAPRKPEIISTFIKMQSSSQ